MNLIGHEAIERELRSFAASDEPPHALLLAGPESTGRRALATHLAQLLNCAAAPGGAKAPAAQPGFGFELAPEPSEAWPCGRCRACHLIAEGTHPDIVTVAPGDTLCRPRAGDTGHEKHAQARDIRICQVRGIIDAVSRFPFEARHRVVIIDPAEAITEPASHAILKTLEEPPGHTVFVLISGAPESIMETVRSRCRRIEVRLVGRQEIEAGLGRLGFAPALIGEAAAASHGRPGRAVSFARQPDLMGDRTRLLSRCGRLASGSLGERFRYSEDLAERWRRDRDRQAIFVELDTWEAFWRTRLHRAAGLPHGDRSPLRGAVEALKAVTQARADLQANVLVRGVFDLMLLTFPRLTLGEVAEEATTPHE